MADDQQPKRKFVFLELDENYYRAIMRLAVEQGVHPADAVEACIVYYIENKTDKTPDDNFFLASQKISDTTRRLAQLRRAAWHVVTSNDDALYDELRAMCEIANVSIESVLASVVTQSEMPIVFDSDTGINAAKVWLETTMSPGVEYPAVTITKKGEELGFASPVLNAAKRDLGIKSVRRGNAWVWLRVGQG